MHEVRVVCTDARGGRHSRPVDFERIGPKLRGKITASRELGGTFVAFIPGEWSARDDQENRLDLRALQGTGKLEAGPLVRRDRSRVRAAQSRCAPLQPDLGTITINPNEPPDTKEQEHGRREPEHIFARAYGFVQPARPATRYLMVSGYARPNVSRVGVAFEARDGRTSEVPVELTQVDRALGERMGADGPFGFFVAFVPARAEHSPIAVSAYDSSGNRLSTDKRPLDP